MWGGEHTSWWEYGDQLTNLWHLFSPPTFACIPGINLKSPALFSKHFMHSAILPWGAAPGCVLCSATAFDLYATVASEIWKGTESLLQTTDPLKLFYINKECNTGNDGPRDSKLNRNSLPKAFPSQRENVLYFLFPALQHDNEVVLSQADLSFLSFSLNLNLEPHEAQDSNW